MYQIVINSKKHSKSIITEMTGSTAHWKFKVCDRLSTTRKSLLGKRKLTVV